MSRSHWRTCSRSRANTKSSTPGFLPTCFEADCSFSGFLRTAGNVIRRPAKLFDRFSASSAAGGNLSLSFGEVAIGSFLLTCSCEHKVTEKQEEDRNESKPRKTGQPDGKRFVFLHHNHRSITFFGRQVPPPAIQQRGVMHPFWYRAHRDVTDQKLVRHA